jgi:hypothetical protein
MRARLLASCAAACLVGSAFAQDKEKYSFDVDKFEKKPFELSGYAELRQESFRLNQDGTPYKLNFYDRDARSRLDGTIGVLELSGLYRQGIATFQATAHGDVSHDSLESSDHRGRMYEAYLTLEPSTGVRFEGGKRALRWGKGYAWSPVGFVERQKDPNDPELSREGFTMFGGSFTRSFDGPLQTVTFTPLLVPTNSQMNSGFGTGDHANPAARLSLLYRDTDIDFLVLGEGARSARYGFDFARNLSTNLEIHGEWARIRDASKPVLGAGGAGTPQTGDAASYLLGLRYLTERDTTWIAEYYRNGAGYSQEQMRAYFNFTNGAYDQYLATGNAAALERAGVLQASYGRPNPMRRYLYVRASQKEPFDILYFTPAVTAIVNLDDHSYSLGPELTYTGITNLDLRLRFFTLQGARLTEFGEKLNEQRIEFRMRYYF